MEEPGMRVVRPVDPAGAPNPKYLIIWLDKHIGKSGECVLLKRSFFMTTDPTTGCEAGLHDVDIDNGIRSSQDIPVRLDGVQFTLRAFSDPNTCYEAIRNNLEKRIFFITSGSKGEIIVPQLVSKFPEKFVGPHAIYVFCANMNMATTAGAEQPANEWAFDYLDNVVMYNFQDDLLARLVLDIARYFFTEAKKLEVDGQPKDALQHYTWSRLMFIRYEQTAKKPNLMAPDIDKVDRRIHAIEPQFRNEED